MAGSRFRTMAGKSTVWFHVFRDFPAMFDDPKYVAAAFLGIKQEAALRRTMERYMKARDPAIHDGIHDEHLS